MKGSSQRPAIALLLGAVTCVWQLGVPADASAHTVVVDGDSTEWFAVAPLGSNVGTVARNDSGGGEFLFADAQLDARTDVDNPELVADLTAFRVTADATNLYFSATMAGVSATEAPPQLQIALDMDRVVASGNLAMAGFADTNVSPEAQWEYLIQTQSTGTALVLDTTYASVGSATIVVASSLEFAVPWSALGLTGPPAAPIRFTVGVFKEDVPTGHTIDVGGSSGSDALDAVTDYGDPGNALNTWSEVSDSTIDYHFDLDFSATGEVVSPLLVSRYAPDGEPVEGVEWLEVHNVSQRALALDGYHLGDEEVPGDGEGMMTFPAGTVLAAGATFVVVQNGVDFEARYGVVADAEFANSGPVPNMVDYPAWATGSVLLSNSGDHALVLGPSNTVLDVVVHGSQSYPGVTAMARPAAGEVAVRTPADSDTDDCAVDFVVEASCGTVAECPGSGAPCMACLDLVCVPAPVDTSCADSDLCDGAEVCDGAGTCAAGAPLVCDDGDVCNGAETCVPATGCANGTPLICDDANACNGVESCDAVNGCEPGTAPDCDDGDVCNGVEACDTATGCVAGTPPSCDDANACNGLETCDAVTGCVAGTPLTCDNADVCDGTETCDAATGCVAGTPLACDDANVCNGVETCDAVTGCVAGTPLTCDNADVCDGTETCDAAAGCVAGTPLPCDDENACNGVETCDAVTGCVDGTPPTCDDGDVCNGVETCDPATGCVDGIDLSCDDTNVCTSDWCDPVEGCQNTAVVCCGDGVAEGNEVCDGDDLGVVSSALCTDYDGALYASGTVTCAAGCTALELGACVLIGEKACYSDEDGDGITGTLQTIADNRDCDEFDTEGRAWTDADGGDCNDLATDPCAGEEAPGRPEICDGCDNDCDGDIDDEDGDIATADVGLSGASTFYADADSDGCGDAASPLVTCAAQPPETAVTNATDADDTDGVCCGNGLVETGEVCDGDDLGDLTSDACVDYDAALYTGGSLACVAGCDAISVLACDTVSVCGDGVFEAPEQCEDGNTNDEDGCSATCGLEEGWNCTTLDDGTLDACVEINGDGLVVGSERCDDGNDDDGDGCTPTGGVEEGWVCTGEPSTCSRDEACGDGTLHSGEACDDGNDDDGDGCSAACQVEDGYHCAGMPSECVIDTDGDGVTDAADNCPNDANLSQADRDNDGLGNICDPDIDDDGLSNEEEEALGTDPTSKDTDHDGLLDGEDPDPLHFDTVAVAPTGDEACGCSIYDGGATPREVWGAALALVLLVLVRRVR